MSAEIREQAIQLSAAIGMHHLQLSYAVLSDSGHVTIFAGDFHRMFRDLPVKYQGYSDERIAVGKLHGIWWECVLPKDSATKDAFDGSEIATEGV